jgi:hypothetical protein
MRFVDVERVLRALELQADGKALPVGELARCRYVLNRERRIIAGRAGKVLPEDQPDPPRRFGPTIEEILE